MERWEPYLITALHVGDPPRYGAPHTQERRVRFVGWNEWVWPSIVIVRVYVRPPGLSTVTRETTRPVRGSSVQLCERIVGEAAEVDVGVGDGFGGGVGTGEVVGGAVLGGRVVAADGVTDWEAGGGGGLGICREGVVTAVLMTGFEDDSRGSEARALSGDDPGPPRMVGRTSVRNHSGPLDDGEALRP